MLYEGEHLIARVKTQHDGKCGKVVGKDNGLTYPRKRRMHLFYELIFVITFLELRISVIALIRVPVPLI
jgi:hypothetical protein